MLRPRLVCLLIALLISLPVAADERTAAGDEPALQEIIDGGHGPFTERLAEWTQEVAEHLIAQLGEAVQVFDPRSDVADWTAFGAMLVEIALVVVPTVALFLLLRLAERPLFRRAAAWSEATTRGGVALVRRAVAVGGSALSDFAVIALAWLAGYLIALYALGERGALDTGQALFLNAFLGLELLKAGFRVLFAPRYRLLRLLSLGDTDAAYWNAWLARLTDFVGYGLLLVVPLVRSELAPALASLLAFLVLLAGLVYAIAIIRQNRDRLRSRFEAAAASTGNSFNRFAFSLLARVWHWIAIVYLVALAAVIQLRPEEALPLMGQATLQSIIIIAAGIGAHLGLSRIIGRPLRVPAATRERLPDIEERINLFVPAGVKVLRVLLGVVVAFALLHAWHLFDAIAWIASERGTRFLATLISVAIIVTVACGLWVVLASWIDAQLQLEGDNGEDIGARKRTLLALFRNALAIVLATMTLMILLAEVGINIAPLIAGAGVLGLAIGFGSQKLVQDIITGVFIQLENAVNTGDFITVGGLSGTVERLSIRSVGIRDIEGAFHIIPFSHVDTVTNYMRDYAYHLGVYGIAYRESTDEAIVHLRAAFEDLMQDPDVAPHILGELEVNGVTGFSDSAVNVRIRIKTVAGMQWFVGRAYNRLVKQHFDAAGIEIPFPHTTLYFGHDKEGEAPPAFVRVLESAAEARAQGQAPSSAPVAPGGPDPAHEGERELPPEFGDVERDDPDGGRGDPQDNDGRR